MSSIVTIATALSESPVNNKRKRSYCRSGKVERLQKRIKLLEDDLASLKKKKKKEKEEKSFWDATLVPGEVWFHVAQMMIVTVPDGDYFASLLTIKALTCTCRYLWETLGYEPTAKRLERDVQNYTYLAECPWTGIVKDIIASQEDKGYLDDPYDCIDGCGYEDPKWGAFFGDIIHGVNRDTKALSDLNIQLSEVRMSREKIPPRRRALIRDAVRCYLKNPSSCPILISAPSEGLIGGEIVFFCPKSFLLGVQLLETLTCFKYDEEAWYRVAGFCTGGVSMRKGDVPEGKATHLQAWEEVCAKFVSWVFLSDFFGKWYQACIREDASRINLHFWGREGLERKEERKNMKKAGYFYVPGNASIEWMVDECIPGQPKILSTDNLRPNLYYFDLSTP